MAKKSARSKGFRKQNAKKPYLSKRDIVLLCLLAAAVAVAAFCLFRYDDGALKVKDDAIVADGDNWLIVNGSNTRGGFRYYKLGEIGELEGFTREAKASSGDARLVEYTFTAQDEGAAVQSAVVSTSHASAEAMSRYAATTLAGVENAEVGDVQNKEIAGQTTYYFLYGERPAEAAETAGEAEPAEETAEEAAAEEAGEAADEAAQSAAPYRRAVRAYIDAPHDSCIVLRMEGSGDSADACPTDEQLLEGLEALVPTVTLEKGGK